MKYQNKYGILNIEDPQEDLGEVIRYLYSKQETIADINSLTLALYSIIGGESAYAILKKGLEMRKAEREQRKNNA